MVMQVLFFYSVIYTEETKLKDDYLFISGLTLSNKYIQARVFSELEKPNDKKPSYDITAWGIEINPFAFFSLNIGNNSYSGIWSRLNNPSPSKISPLKQKYVIQKRLLSSLPSSTSSKKPLSIELNLSFPLVAVQAISSISPEETTFSGIGFSIPFTLYDNKDNPHLQVSGRWSNAWKMTKLYAKESDSWFSDSKLYLPDYYHSAISELSLRLPYNTVLLSTGISQNPFEKPSGFFRGEYSLQVNPFLLNAQFFICEVNFLDQNGRFQQDTIKASINPQLRFNYFSGIVRSFKLGGTASIELQNGDSFFDEARWVAFFDIESEIQCIFITFNASASLSDLLINSESNNSTAPLQNNSPLKIQTTILLRPWYFEIIDRVWSIGGAYENEIFKPTESGDLIVDIKLSAKSKIEDIALISSNLYAESKISLEKAQKNASVVYGAKLKLALMVNFFELNQKLELSAQSEFNPTSNTIKSEFSLTFAIDA